MSAVKTRFGTWIQLAKLKLYFPCFHGKFLGMATNAKLSNSVNWRSMKPNFCLKIYLNIYSLVSSHDIHISYDIKVL